MLKNAAYALSTATRECDVVARTGGDEFAVLAVQSDEHQCNALVARINDLLAQVNLRGSIGFSKRDPAKSLADAWVQSDQNMYLCKRDRKREQNRSAGSDTAVPPTSGSVQPTTNEAAAN